MAYLCSVAAGKHYGHVMHEDVLINKGPCMWQGSQKTIMELKSSYCLVTLKWPQCHCTMHFPHMWWCWCQASYAASHRNIAYNYIKYIIFENDHKRLLLVYLLFIVTSEPTCNNNKKKFRTVCYVTLAVVSHLMFTASLGCIKRPHSLTIRVSLFTQHSLLFSKHIMSLHMTVIGVWYKQVLQRIVIDAYN